MVTVAKTTDRVRAHYADRWNEDVKHCSGSGAYRPVETFVEFGPQLEDDDAPAPLSPEALEHIKAGRWAYLDGAWRNVEERRWEFKDGKWEVRSVETTPPLPESDCTCPPEMGPVCNGECANEPPEHAKPDVAPLPPHVNVGCCPPDSKPELTATTPEGKLTTASASKTAPTYAPRYSQPEPPRKTPRKRGELTGDAAQLAAHMREVFWDAVHKQARTLQTVIGPSEIGHECTRRIAYKLAGTVQCNHSQDGWAAWVGTQIHKGLEDIFRARDAGSGRYLVDFRVNTDSKTVPGGTLDRADRVLSVVMDDKAMGSSSLSKAWLDGPSQQYRVQLHTYAYGMELAGERFDKVALVAWPREAGKLDDLYVWVAPYDRTVAVDAIRRVEGIAERITAGELPGEFDPSPSFMCRFCPYHMADSSDLTRGCPGR
jgi:hypothetical protein